MATPEAANVGIAAQISEIARRKYKASDLPISTEQRTTVEKLLHSYKKKGGFDSLRKQVWAEFGSGVSRNGIKQGAE